MNRFQIRRAVVVFVLLSLTLLLILLIGRSLQWRYQHDSAVMLYFGYTIDRFGLVPYRDLFDINGPGAYLAYIILGRLTGYGDPGIRVADIVYLTAISGVTWLLLSRFNRFVAWLAVVGFGLAYLLQGPIFSFEREYFMILPIGLTVLISTRIEGRYHLKAFLVGLLFCATATIKPHAALGLPIVLLYIIYEATAQSHRSRQALLAFIGSIVASTLIGFAIPAAVVGIYLAANNAIPALLDVVHNFIPLYSKIGSDIAIIEKPLPYYLRHLTDIGSNLVIAPWLLPAALGTGIALSLLRSPLSAGYVSSPTGATRLKPQVVLLVALAIGYLIYPAFQGQFFPYQYLLVLYFLTMLSALALLPLTDRIDASVGKLSEPLNFYLPLLTAVAVPLVVLPFWAIYSQIAVPQPVPTNGVPDRIASYLKAHLQPGDTVLSSDWTYAGLHAMLLSGARPADRYLDDVFLYMNVSTPYVQQLRQDYLKEMIAASPRYVIQIVGAVRPFVTGPDTTQSFPAFQAILDSSYKVVDSGPVFNLYERIPATLPTASP